MARLSDAEIEYISGDLFKEGSPPSKIRSMAQEIRAARKVIEAAKPLHMMASVTHHGLDEEIWRLDPLFKALAAYDKLTDTPSEPQNTP